MDRRNEPLIENHFYHLYNRGVGNDRLFRNEENYFLFLEKIEKYLFPIARIFAYSLLPIYFRLFVRIRSAEELRELAAFLDKRVTPSVLVSEQFSNLFNSYSKSFNNVFERHGKLFDLPFKRVEVTDEWYYPLLIAHMHCDPFYHGAQHDFKQWKFSSYHDHLSGQPNIISKTEVLDWMGGKEGFIKFHEEKLPLFQSGEYFPELLKMLGSSKSWRY